MIYAENQALEKAGLDPSVLHEGIGTILVALEWIICSWMKKGEDE